MGMILFPFNAISNHIEEISSVPPSPYSITSLRVFRVSNSRGVFNARKSGWIR